MKTTIKPFLFGETTIRTANFQGKPWFIAKDVCDVLGLLNPTKTLQGLDEDEKITLTTGYGNPRAGIPHQMAWINESGLYALIFKSRKEEAVRFRKWVTSEVLPAIRRTGTYHRGHRAYLSLIEDQIALGISPDLAARCAARLHEKPTAREMAMDLGDTIDDSLPQDIREIISVMEPGKAYTIRDLLAALAAVLPKKHPLFNKATLPAQNARLGKLLEKARLSGRINRLPGRTVHFQLAEAEIIPITSQL